MTQSKPFGSTMHIEITPDDAAGQVPAAEPSEAVWQSRSDAPDGPHCPIVGSPDFRELLTNLYDGTIITDLNGRIVNANERATLFFQGTQEVLCTISVTQLISGADDSLLTTICESLENEQFVLIQAFCIRADGTVFPAEISVNCLLLSGEEFLSFFIRDTTQRRKTEDWLRTGSAAIENSANAIAAADLHGILEYANPAMATLLAASSVDTLLGRDIWTFLDHPDIAEAITASVSVRQTWAGLLRLIPTRGAHVDVQASIAPNINADGELTGMVLSLLDVTDQIRTHQRLRDRNEQMTEDLQLAREFQQAFVRKQYPVFPTGVAPKDSAVEFAHIYRSSGAVGGDFFDLLPLSDTRVGIFISDVMGHGVRSALVAATVRGLLEELIVLADHPGTFLTAVNRDLHTLISPGGNVAFVTACYMVLDLTTGVATLACAGHPAPYWIQHSRGKVSRLELKRHICGPAMGIFPDAEYRNDRLTIEPTDTLLFYTDGVGEAENGKKEAYEDRRMSDYLNAHTELDGDALLSGIMADAEAFHGGSQFEDDICIIGTTLRHLLPGQIHGSARK